MVSYAGARYGHQRSRPTVAMERARRPSVLKLGEVTTTDECLPELSPSLPPSPHAQEETPAVDGKLPATPQRHDRVSHPLTDKVSIEARAEFRYNGERCCSPRGM
ncbi:hypothetical protein Acr_15g0006300 [Actinidia rufa]|uniref:Uncharacterized protein n=1 Tax=Actinidia rufa TaxID=165716 RepID=A0A7J0FTK6_9ERIC|nr:hypothetical protein Acr_15g0006300 [Actinidia rufa]